MPSASSFCWYCGLQFRSSDSGKPSCVAVMSTNHGPPATEEITSYGKEPTPDRKAPHAALSPDAPKAHARCCKWLIAINMVVANVRRGRSAGLDDREPAVQRSRQRPTVALMAEELALEAADFSAGSSSAQLPSGLRVKQESAGLTAAEEPMEIETMSTVSTTEVQPGSSSAAGATAAEAAVTGAASSQLAGAAQVKAVALPARRRKGIIDPSRPLHTLKYRPLLRVAKQRAEERNTFRKQLRRKIEQHKKVRAHP